MSRPAYKALLLDLDGTLLEIDMEQFIPVYIKHDARSFAPYAAPQAFVTHLIGATRAVLQNTDPALINETVFYNDFCRRLGQPRETVSPLFDRFYQDEFPLLRSWSRPRPGAQKVVEAASHRGLKLVLATDPLFPLPAIAHRLDWGGLSPADFDLITTIENMHSCKPQPRYYLEIAARIGCAPEACLMAGNDVQKDLSAAAVGMDTFLVDDFILHRANTPPACTYRGSLADLADLISDNFSDRPRRL